MKQLLFVALVALMTACSASRYAANFHYYKPNPELAGGYGVIKTQKPAITPIEPEKLVASAGMESMPVLEKTPIPIAIGTLAGAEQVRKAYFQMNKAERKYVQNAVKSELKKQIQLKKNSKAAPARGRGWWQGWDQDLKLAAIFGAIGTVAFIIYVEPFWIIAAVALIIGLVFFIKWFVRQ
jgi:hypothetical protein